MKLHGPISNSPELNAAETLKNEGQKQLDRLNRLFKKGPTRELLGAIKIIAAKVIEHHVEVERLYAAEVDCFLAGYNVTARALQAYERSGLTQEDMDLQAEMMKPESVSAPGGGSSAYDQGAYYAAEYYLENAEVPATINKDNIR